MNESTRTGRIAMLSLLIVWVTVFAGCVSTFTGNGATSSVPTLTLLFSEADERPLGETGVLRRPWQVEGVDAATALLDARAVALSLSVEQDNAAGHFARSRTIAAERLASHDTGGVVLTLGEAGRIHFESGDESIDRGTAVIELEPSFVDGVEAALATRSSLIDIVRAGVADVRLADVQAYAATGMPIALADVARLKWADVAPATIKASREAGYRWEASDLVRLSQMRVDVDDAIALRTAGYELDASELIRLRQMRVSTGFATAVREAGWDLSVGELVRLKQMRVPRQMLLTAAELDEPDVSELIRLKQMRVPMEDVVAYEQAGYGFSTGDLVRLRQMRVQTDDAVAYREAGYAFTVSELVRLKQFRVDRDYVLALATPDGDPLIRVDRDYVLALATPDGDPLSADEILSLDRANIDLEMIERLRGQAGE